MISIDKIAFVVVYGIHIAVNDIETIYTLVLEM